MNIVWTDFAIKNLKDIFDYHATKVNKKVAHKIRNQILASSKQLKNHPHSGAIEPNLTGLNINHRYLVSGNYKLIYRDFNNQVIINDVFDTRQDPSKMYDYYKR